MNRGLVFFCGFAFALLSTVSFGQVEPNIPTDHLLGYWPFNGNANDESGHLRHGVVSGAFLSEDRYGTGDAAYFFTKTDDVITIPDTVVSRFDNDFTISFWFKSDHSHHMEPFTLSDSGHFQTNLNFSFNNRGRSSFTYWNSAGSNSIRIDDGRAFANGFWHNVVFLREGSVLKIYFDGRLRGVSDNVSDPIGGGYGVTLGGGPYPWLGGIDDLLIYGRALTEEEILRVANQPRIAVTFPDALSALPVETGTSIRWLMPNDINSVKVEYSVNNGSSWNLISEETDSAAVSLTWIVPNLPGHKGLIRITERDSPYRVAVSDTFLISKYKWELVNANAQFSVRDGAGAYVLNDQMLLVGGWNPLDPENYPLVTNSEVWQTADGLNWNLATVAPWEPRHTFGAVVHNDKLWVLGGDQLQCSFQPDVWNSEDGVRWNLVNEKAPWGERMLHMTFVFDNKMWVMGGQKIIYCDNTEEELYNDVWNSEDGITWNLVTNEAEWSPRGLIGGSCVFENKMWILGGGQYQKANFNDVWNSEDGVTWNRVSDRSPWMPRQYHSVAVFDSLMWLMEGYNGGNRNGVWHSDDGVRWYNLMGTPWGPRHASSIFNFDNSLWIVAGNMWNDVWRLKNVCPQMLQHPQDQDVAEGQTAMFSVEFSGSSPTYQWQVHTPNGWENLDDDAQLSGSRTNTLAISNVTQDDDRSRFRCIASDGSCTDISQEAVLAVCSGFNSHPFDQIVVEGDPASFESSHRDTTAVFQWQMDAGNGWIDVSDDLDYKGSLTNTLTVVGATRAQDGQLFRVIVRSSGGVCEIISDVAVLRVCADFVQHPTSQNARYNTTASFSVEYPEQNATYSWQTDLGSGWVPLPESGLYSGTRSSELVVSHVSLENDSQKFMCVVNFGDCSLTSDVAALTVTTEHAAFPNPLHDFVTITLDEFRSNVKFFVIDNLGKVCIEGSLTSKVNVVNFGQLRPGLYTLKVSNTSAMIKLIKL